MIDTLKDIRDRYSEADQKWEKEGDSHEEGYAMGIEFTVYKLNKIYPGLAERVWPNE